MKLVTYIECYTLNLVTCLYHLVTACFTCENTTEGNEANRKKMEKLFSPNHKLTAFLDKCFTGAYNRTYSSE